MWLVAVILDVAVNYFHEISNCMIISRPQRMAPAVLKPRRAEALPSASLSCSQHHFSATSSLCQAYSVYLHMAYCIRPGNTIHMVVKYQWPSTTLSDRTASSPKAWPGGLGIQSTLSSWVSLYRPLSSCALLFLLNLPANPPRIKVGNHVFSDDTALQKSSLPRTPP